MVEGMSRVCDRAPRVTKVWMATDSKFLLSPSKESHVAKVDANTTNIRRGAVCTDERVI